MSILTTFPLAPMLLSFLIPLIFFIYTKQGGWKKTGIVFFCCVAIVILYPIIFFISTEETHTIVYFLGKLVLFTWFPLIVLTYVEKDNLQVFLQKIGVRKQHLGLSILLGLLSIIVTLLIALLVSFQSSALTDPLWNIIMFVDAFNEEFLFRGILLLYLMKLTNMPIAYATSVLAFTLAHPQYFSSMFLISTLVQGVLLGLITIKTKNILGPWISHGLNRTIIQGLRLIF